MYMLSTTTEPCLYIYSLTKIANRCKEKWIYACFISVSLDKVWLFDFFFVLGLFDDWELDYS